MMCWTFYDISTQGYFILGESRLAVLYFEWGLIGFSFIYVVYLLVVFVKGKAEIKKIIWIDIDFEDSYFLGALWNACASINNLERDYSVEQHVFQSNQKIEFRCIWIVIVFSQSHKFISKTRLLKSGIKKPHALNLTDLD